MGVRSLCQGTYLCFLSPVHYSAQGGGIRRFCGSSFLRLARSELIRGTKLLSVRSPHAVRTKWMFLMLLCYYYDITVVFYEWLQQLIFSLSWCLRFHFCVLNFWTFLQIYVYRTFSVWLKSFLHLHEALFCWLFCCVILYSIFFGPSTLFLPIFVKLCWRLTTWISHCL